MSAGEKVAWAELVISIVATAVVFALVPWLGWQVATSGFALMALIAVFGAVFLRRRGSQVVIDERDREISRAAVRVGVSAAWLVLFGTLLVIVVWWGVTQTESVSVEFLTVLVWLDSAIVYGMQGLAGVILYRRQRHAA